MEESDKSVLTALMQHGYRLIPLKSGDEGKKPLHEGYAERSYGLPDLTGNVGMIIDTHHVDVDLDWDVPRSLLQFLPGTGCGIIRGKGKWRHLIYRAHLPKPINFELPTVEGHKLDGPHAHTVLQLRTSMGGEPYHVMVSPSVHPDTGEQLYWSSAECIPREHDGDDLVRCAGLVAAATFFVRFYPCEGGRDEFALALAGTLVRAKWSDADAETFFEAVAAAAGDTERTGQRAKQMIAKARKRLDEGRTLRGLSSMAKLLGVPSEWIRTVAVWLQIRKSHDGEVIFDTGLVTDTSRQAWEALEHYEIDSDPAVYAYGDTFARIDRDQVQVLEKQSFTYELNRAAKWLRRSEEGDWAPANARAAVVDDMLACRARDVRLSDLKVVATTPVFTRDGKLITQRGYDHEA